ncbi:DUF982 domain-containing protein [Chelativorans sp. J32]|uniref:DUF982 domain-containing protein n=1 Tax=Chelativorans sp. J32 TaxID=935840 RepID=UPI0004870C64|nr:DUF982 domain-containing protein [Chelativorans sp. J32]
MNVQLLPLSAVLALWLAKGTSMQPHFQLPVRIVLSPGENAEVWDLEQAIDIVAQFPIESDAVLERAFDSFVSATEDSELVENAWEAFLDFAETYGILASDMPAPGRASDGLRCRP